MSIFKPRRLLAGLGVLILVIGGYEGWQVYQGQQPANRYTADAEKLTQGNPSSGEYKKLMAKTYQQTLQTMQAVKGNTLAWQGRKLSLAAYRTGILQSQASFSSAEEFVRANPPTERNLNPSYREFLTGISLAKESMGVVLKGISSLNPSSFYTALGMGKEAQAKIKSGYSRF